MATRASSCNCGRLSLKYEGPDPQRISLCQCYECQKRTGTVLSVQARVPREQVTIEGRSTTWTFPVKGGEPATFRSCDSGGATYHFCPECGSTVYPRSSIEAEAIARPALACRRKHKLGGAGSHRPGEGACDPMVC